MAARLLVAVAFSPFALAFSNTAPLVLWSSTSSNAIDLLPSVLSHSDHSASLANAIVSQDDICSYDAVVFIQQPGLHASDLRALPSNTHLSRCLSSSPSSKQYPHVPHRGTDLSSLADHVSNLCGSRLLKYSLGEGRFGLEHGKKHVVCLDMPELSHSGQARKSAIEDHEAKLGVELSALESAFPNHVIIYTGSPLPARGKRDVPSQPALDVSSGNVYINANTTLPDGGILKRYQLLTPALITGLLVSFFILVPILMMGLTALSSIQNPLKTEIPKGFNAQDKKNQ